MKTERQEFLRLPNHPARLNAQETAWYLGFATREIPRLARAKLLKPLGNPEPCATKYYATVRLRHLRDDETWLNKATTALFKFWREANRRRDQDSDE